ncbi:MAG: hypothetical protein KatS3mg131_2627 [Candidatus Tectimicrobiota bacterium]|nr:MAG: hypothetical protein KatS3mg131_2627 [Candidatus Tectomicrobia bacterium]
MCGKRLALAILVGIFWSTSLRASPPPSATCPVPPAFDPGIGALYLCTPEEGERHLIAYAKRSLVDPEVPEDIWANFRGIFGDRVWINLGLMESGDAALPAWDALASLLEWLHAIKGGDAAALEAFLAPLETNPTYSAAEESLKRQLLRTLMATAREPAATPLHVVLYHVHLQPRQQGPSVHPPPWLNALLSLPSHEDLLATSQLQALAPQSQAKIAVAAGIWTYTLDAAQAARFVAEHYRGPAEAPFAAKFAEVYTRLAARESRQPRACRKRAPSPPSACSATLRRCGPPAPFFTSPLPPTGQASPPVSPRLTRD